MKRKKIWEKINKRIYRTYKTGNCKNGEKIKAERVREKQISVYQVRRERARNIVVGPIYMCVPL